MNFSSKKLHVIKMPIALVGVLVVLVIYLNSCVGLTNGYMLINDRLDDYHIEKHGEVIIPHAIVDFEVLSGYVIGLRLPAKYLECERGTALRIVMTFKKEYFILDGRSGKALSFQSKDEFYNNLKKLNLYERSKLNDSKFEEIWERYSRYYKGIDFSGCRELDKPAKWAKPSHVGQ